MGNSYQPANQTVGQIFQDLQQYAPAALKALQPSVNDQAIAQAHTDAAVAPITAQSNLDLYKQFSPELNAIGAANDAANQKAASATELGLVKGTGGELANEALKLQQGIDPEYFKQRAALSGGFDQLLGGMDPNKLSGSEQAETGRAASRTLGFTPSAGNTTANAMTFGHELQNKQSRFSDTLSKLSAALPSLTSGISGFQAATKRSVSPNAGAGMLGPGATNTGQQGWNFLNNGLNVASQAELQREGQRKSLMDQVSQGMGIGGQFLGGIAGGLGA